MTETELEYQFCFNCNDRKNCYTKPKDCTRIKEEIGLQDMTNEEWLHTMNAEQLAEFLVMIQMSVMHPVKRGAVDMEKFIEEVIEWLKQPHGGES